MSNRNSFDLQRFIDAQEQVFESVLLELRAGHKESHWMWFIFPQLRGLGHSAMAQTYAISSREEAAAYFTHSVLGPRLIECTEHVNAVNGKSITTIFGTPDDLKFRSSMTLFSLAVPDQPVFQHALEKYFHGEPDARTVKGLALTGH